MKLLGKGAYATVYLVKHENLNVQRACKCMNHQSSIPDMRKEADILKDLRHPAIPIIYDIEETSDGICMIEEYISGDSLQSLIFPQNTISYPEVIHYAIQLCDVVNYLHAHGICHHDIKPENIIISNKQLKLLDYGSADSIAHMDYDMPHMGTHGYAAPEMYGRNLVGVEADIYSIGIVILAMANQSVTSKSLEAMGNSALAQIITRCLHHSRTERYHSLQALQEALLALKQQESPQSYIYHFAGIDSHAGTTYAARRLSASLLLQGHRPLLMEAHDHDDFIELFRVANHIRFMSGIVIADGLSYLPNYHGLAEPNHLDDYDIRIYDHGVVGGDQLISFLPEGELYLVTTSSPRDLHKLERVLDELRDSCAEYLDRLHILVNFANASTYKKLVRQYRLINPTRIPYQP